MTKTKTQWKKLSIPKYTKVYPQVPMEEIEDLKEFIKEFLVEN